MVCEPDPQPEEAQKGNPPPRRPVVIRVFRALKSYEDSRRRRHKKEARETDIVMARWTRRVGWFTLGLVLVGIITAGIFWRQLNVMEGQLSEARGEQRPWVFIDGVPTLTNFESGGNDAGIFFMLKVHLKSSGQSPAQKIVVGAAGGIGARRLSDEKASACDASKRDYFDASFVMFPNTDAWAYARAKFSDGDIKKAMKYTRGGTFSIPNVVLCVTYRFGQKEKIHHTLYVYSLMGANGGAIYAPGRLPGPANVRVVPSERTVMEAD